MTIAELAGWISRELADLVGGCDVKPRAAVRQTKVWLLTCLMLDYKALGYAPEFAKFTAARMIDAAFNENRPAGDNRTDPLLGWLEQQM